MRSRICIKQRHPGKMSSGDFIRDLNYDVALTIKWSDPIDEIPDKIAAGYLSRMTYILILFYNCQLSIVSLSGMTCILILIAMGRINYLKGLLYSSLQEHYLFSEKF
jgi:hypothetical protein